MADGFQRPVGIAVDGARGRVYISDAGSGDFLPAGQAETGLSFLQALTGSSARETGVVSGDVVPMRV
jgi:hypothetical protein